MTRLRREDVEYMTEVEAALRRKGHPLAYVLSMSMLVVLIVFVGWAHFAVLDEVTRGMGQVIPSQRVQEIQNLEGGILREILVREGQNVEKNAVLVRLFNEQARSNFREAFSKTLEHMAAIARLTAEAEGVEPVFPAEVKKDAPQFVADQMRVYNARRLQLDSEVAVLESQYEQKLQEVEEMVSRKRQLVKSHKIALERRDIARPLMEKKVYPRVEYLQIEERVLTLQGDIDGLALGIPRARKAASEVKKRIQQRVNEFHSAAFEEINRRRVELTSLKELMSAGEDRVTRTDVRSPVRGTVKRINTNTVGGVVRPGDTIMEIVPLDDTLLIEARVRPADIAFLHPGQKAMVKITAYDFSIYGGLEASVEQISADTIEDRRGDQFYLVKLRTKKNAMMYQGERLPIIPGMTASIDVLTGKKSVLDYLLKPILKAQQNALRER